MSRSMENARRSSRSICAAPAPALAVLCDRALLKHVTQFQTGIPVGVHDLVERYDDHRRGCRDCLSDWQHSPFWASAMRLGDLRDVQFLFYMREMPEYASMKEIKIGDLQLPSFAVRCGRHDVLQWWQDAKMDVGQWRGKLLALAIRFGHAETARWIMKHRESSVSDAHVSKALACAATNGDVVGIKELLAFRPRVLTPRVMDVALMQRQWELIRFLHETDDGHISGVGCTTLAMDKAAEQGFLDVVEFLHENRTEGCTTRAIDAAARYGRLDIVKYLHEYRSEGCTTNAMDSAARYGHLDVVRFLHEHRREGCTTRAMDYAAMRGHLNIVRFLHEQRTEGCTTRAMDAAAHQGHLAVVKYLHEHRAEGCTTRAMDNAAQQGHLDVVTFLHEHRSEGCTREAMDLAACGGHVDVLRFLHENRTEGPTSMILYVACRRGHLDAVQFLHKVCGVRAQDVHMYYAMVGGRLELVRYLHEVMGVPFNELALSRATASRNGELIEYVTRTVAANLAQMWIATSPLRTTPWRYARSTSA